MFQNSWSAEDQQALDKIAKKLDVVLEAGVLEANDLAGAEATFTSIEVAASKIGRAVTRQVIEDLAIKQTELLDQPQPCPDCQRLCEVRGRTRSLTTGGGTADINEAVCHCSECRRDFFPSTCSVTASPTWL